MNIIIVMIIVFIVILIVKTLPLKRSEKITSDATKSAEKDERRIILNKVYRHEGLIEEKPMFRKKKMLAKEVEEMNGEIDSWSESLSKAKEDEEEIVFELNEKIKQVNIMLKKHKELSKVEQEASRDVLKGLIRELKKEIMIKKYEIIKKRKEEIQQKFQDKADRVMEKN